MHPPSKSLQGNSGRSSRGSTSASAPREALWSPWRMTLLKWFGKLLGRASAT